MSAIDALPWISAVVGTLSLCVTLCSFRRGGR